MRTRRFFASLCLITIAGACLLQAAVVPEPNPRFSGLVIHDPSSLLGQTAERPDQLPGFDAEHTGWAAFGSANGGWRSFIDRRSGAPMLAEGRGIRWTPFGSSAPSSLAELEALARGFVGKHESLFKIRESELVLNTDGSGPMDANHWLLLFGREVDGIPVEEQRFRLYVTYGKLTAFGADRWGEIAGVPEVVYDRQAARKLLHAYMGLTASDVVEEATAELVIVATPPADQTERRYSGAVGAGIEFRLAWKFALLIADDLSTWVGKIDAVSGEVIAFYDDARYAQAKGGVYPASNDGSCTDGCEQPAFPMPWTDIDIDGAGSTSNDVGLFECSPNGGTATTTLSGQFVNILDRCGSVSESVTCDNELDLGVSAGTDCVVPGGSSAGNTHAARTCFFHANRVKEKGRNWLPANSWLQQQLTCDVNINNNCNAVWSGGQINFYTSGGGCRNTGEIGGVIHHEFGHGLDGNDGGGFDNPSEAYADVVAILQERRSCLGRGFRTGSTCSGYGDSCLTCTGIRDLDWDARAAHTPATPANFIQPNCGNGSGACGRETHCESYPPSEAIFDLATRDLPAMGLDPQSAWQLADRLFFQSRQGSGGAIYNCTLPNSDSCGAGTWYTQMRTLDDDDGDLNNGTPHAAAIFAAFDRHNLACGTASDPTNQNSSTCPSLATPSLIGTAGSNSTALSWGDVTGAAEYRILRNEISCDEYSFNVAANIGAPTTDYTDDDLANDFSWNYRVQAVGANLACESAVSNCVSVTPQPFAGTVKLDRAVYACDKTINISVRDANVAVSSFDVTIWSDSEPAPETVTLVETAPGSSKFLGSIAGTAGAAVNGDGMLALAHSDTITARYTDDDDGQGGSGLVRETTASADCVGPTISNVTETNVTDVAATITWNTNEASSSILHWGGTTPPANTDSTPGLTTSHSVSLSGLQQCTVYFFSVESADDPGNVAVDDKSGAYYLFETLGDFGQGLQPCHDGQVTLESSVVSCSSSLPIKLVDIDLNLDSGVADTVNVSVSSSTETTPEAVVLTETGPNTSTFTGSISTAAGPPVFGDGILQTSDGDALTASYQDADNGTGAPDVDFDTGIADCAGTGLLSVEVRNIGDEVATIRWISAEPTTGTVDWGDTPALGNSASSTTLQTVHDVVIQPLAECGLAHFRVTATDAYGNTAVSDVEGSPYQFNAYEIPGAVFKDGFESSTGWTLQGEWEVGTSQGFGTAPSDPAVAFAGSDVLGHDLSGQGSSQGNYEAATTEFATSPVIDASSLTNAELKFRRWLNVAPGASSSLEVFQGGTWTLLWASETPGLTESSWSLQTFDVSAYADGNASFQVRFKQYGGFSPASGDAGWNIDRFIVRNGSLPEFATCGSCGGGPTFAGVVSAVDVDPCADSDISFGWNPAPGWGSGSGGTYAVYRSTDPGFTPSPGNLVAAGIAGTSYNDVSAPNDTDLYYVVRAENNETCDVGPSNGGVMDANLVRIAVRDDTAQAAPGDVGDALRVDGVNHAHVRLNWPAVGGAASYHVYRSDSPSGGFAQIADVAGTSVEDVDEFGSGATRFYLVQAADACGNEGP